MALVSRLLFTAATVRPRCEEKGEGQRPGFSGERKRHREEAARGETTTRPGPQPGGRRPARASPGYGGTRRRPSVLGLEGSHTAASTPRPRKPLTPTVPEAHPRRPHNTPRGGWWWWRWCGERPRACAPWPHPPGPPHPAPPRPLACAPPRARLSERRLAHAGPAEHWLPEPHRARVGVVVAGARL